MGAHICRPDLLCWRFTACWGLDPGCCGDAAKVCLTLGLLLLANLHVGTNDTARGDLEHIKCDYVHLEAMVKGMGAQVVFSLIFPVRSKGLRRNGRILWVNSWLPSWR